VRIAIWDLLFYLSFGVVITSAVAIGGVLIVFSYLVIPAVIVALFTRDLTKRLFAGWGVGILASVLGMYVSYTLDTPTGAAVVACFGGLLLVAIGLSRFVELPAAESDPLVRREQRTAK
jgi:zinc/manganese transport system permease protein